MKYSEVEHCVIERSLFQVITTAPAFEISDFQFDLCKNILKDHPKNALKVSFVPLRYMLLLVFKLFWSHSYLVKMFYFRGLHEVSPLVQLHSCTDGEKWVSTTVKKNKTCFHTKLPEKKVMNVLFKTFDLHFCYTAWPELQSSLFPVHETQKVYGGQVTLTKREKYATFCCFRNLPTITKQFTKFHVAGLPKTLIFTSKRKRT